MNETTLSEIPSGAIKLALNIALTQQIAPVFFGWLARVLLAELSERERGATAGQIRVRDFDSDTTPWEHDLVFLRYFAMEFKS